MSTAITTSSKHKAGEQGKVETVEKTGTTVTSPAASTKVSAAPRPKKASASQKRREPTMRAAKEPVAKKAGIASDAAKKSSSKKAGVAASTTKKAPAKKTQARKRKGEEGKNQKLGRVGEDMACHYLKNNEIAILERNWKCKSGEADIIAEENDTLIFIEVKTRSEGFPGLPEYAVTKQKRTRYEKIAISYLSKHKRPSGRIRFDVIAIQMTGEQQCMLRHHRDAFAADEQ